MRAMIFLLASTAVAQAQYGLDMQPSPYSRLGPQPMQPPPVIYTPPPPVVYAPPVQTYAPRNYTSSRVGNQTYTTCN